MTQPIQGDPGEYSRETRAWLSEMVKVGFTEQRGMAWHWREGDQNHFPGAVPLEVAEDLFNFEVVKEPVVVAGKPRETVAWYAPQFDTVFGYFSKGAKIHPYSEWLVANMDALLDGKLEIGGAGLLRDRSVAYLQAELPETHADAQTGESFRGSVLAFTSLDGTLASTYQLAFTRVICDNTFRRARGADTSRIKIRHTRNSALDVEDAQMALGLLDAEMEKVQEEIRFQVSMPVSDRQWGKFLDAFVPVPEEVGRGRTMAEHKRESLTQLWNTSEMVEPWKGTAWGVTQAVNTYNQHLRAVKATAARWERNMLNVANGKLDTEDREAMWVLNGILDGALTPA